MKILYFRQYCAFVALLLLFHPVEADKTIARTLFYSEYHTKLLRAALEATVEDYGNYEIDIKPNDLPVLRIWREVKRGKRLNMFVGPAIKDLEHPGIIPIPIPILKGIDGIRVMIIHQDQQERLAKLSAEKEIKSLLVGQMYGWIDVDIFRNSDMRVESFYGDISDAYPLVMNKRIDGFPMGVGGIFALYEAAKGQYTSLSLEKTMAFYYPLPNFFFVSEKDPLLFKRVQAGLERIIASGEMDRLFDAYFKESLDSLNLKKRKVVYLENPFIMDQVPLERSELWIHNELFGK